MDDPATPRVLAWRDPFAAAPTDPGPDGRWWDAWLAVLADSSELDPSDDRAIIRDNRAHGFPTMSQLVSVATVSNDGVDIRMAILDHPGRWNDLHL